MFEGFAQSTANVNGVDVSYVTAGSGPPVLLLHGYPQTKAMWARVAPQLTQNFTVVCADLRGYGDSGKPICSADYETYSFRTMASDQIGLMRHLGFETFHLVGHDRGARTAHRLALDHSHAVLTLTLMDIIPTLTAFETMDRHLAQTYWHWLFLSQPAPFPETMIAHDPNRFYETNLLGWGAATLEDFDPEQLAAYRVAWNDPEMMRASCDDYRAAARIDLDHDRKDIDTKVTCPTLILYGENGAMARLFDVPNTWQEKCTHLQSQAIPGGHFFIDEHPEIVTTTLEKFLSDANKTPQ